MLVLGGTWVGLASIASMGQALAAGAAQTDWVGPQGRAFRPSARHLQVPSSPTSRLQSPAEPAGAATWRYELESPLGHEARHDSVAQPWTDRTGGSREPADRFRPLAGSASPPSFAGAGDGFRPLTPKRPVGAMDGYRQPERPGSWQGMSPERR